MPTKLFFHENSSGISDYKDMLTTPPTGSTVALNGSTTAGGTEVYPPGCSWISGYTPPGGFTLTTTDISMWQYETNMNANIGGRYRLYKRTIGGTETELGGGPFNDGVEMAIGVGNIREDSWVGNCTDTAFAVNDRLVVKYFITAAGGTMAVGYQGFVQFNSATYDSFLNIAQTVAFGTHPFPSAPTLNSPSDAGSTGDLTPTFDFTGTAPDADSLEYEVQIDTSSSFNSQQTTFESYTTAVTPNKYDSYTSNVGVGQSWTPAADVNLAAVKLRLRKLGSPTGNALVKLYIGATGNPSGSHLVAGSLDISTLTTSYQWITVEMGSVYRLTAGVNYVITAEYSGGDASNCLQVELDLDGTDGGVLTSYALGAWTSSLSDDLLYELLSGDALLDKLSSIPDAGFANPDNGGDTHPFNSGENIQYTVQSDLSAGTYYWRVRTKDASGGATDWSLWSATRSLIITSVPAVYFPVSYGMKVTI